MIRSGLFSQSDPCYQRTHVGTLAIVPHLSLNKPLSLYLSTVRGLQLNCLQQSENVPVDSLAPVCRLPSGQSGSAHLFHRPGGLLGQARVCSQYRGQTNMQIDYEN